MCDEEFPEILRGWFHSESLHEVLVQGRVIHEAEGDRLRAHVLHGLGWGARAWNSDHLDRELESLEDEDRSQKIALLAEDRDPALLRHTPDHLTGAIRPEDEFRALGSGIRPRVDLGIQVHDVVHDIEIPGSGLRGGTIEVTDLPHRSVHPADARAAVQEEPDPRTEGRDVEMGSHPLEEAVRALEPGDEECRETVQGFLEMSLMP